MCVGCLEQLIYTINEVWPDGHVGCPDIDRRGNNPLTDSRVHVHAPRLCHVQTSNRVGVVLHTYGMVGWGWGQGADVPWWRWWAAARDQMLTPQTGLPVGPT